MERMTVHEVVALFEGLVQAEERRLRAKYQYGGRFKWEIGEEELHIQFVIRKRKFELYVGSMIDAVLWYDKRSCGVDDYISDCSSTPYTNEDVLRLARLLQSRYFPLLENPEVSSEELFPEMWE